MSILQAFNWCDNGVYYKVLDVYFNDEVDKNKFYSNL